jgi:hypothetical protein
LQYLFKRRGEKLDYCGALRHNFSK